MKKLLGVFSFLILSISIFGQGQLLNPVDWSTSYKHVSGNEFDLIFTADIEDKWAIYSQNIPEDGPVPTSFYYDKGDHYERMGKTKESGHRKVIFDKVFQMEIAKFTNKAIFTQRIKVNDYSKPITGYLEFMTCDDKRCLPPTEVDYSFTIEKPTVTTESVTPPKKEEPKEKNTPKETSSIEKTVEKEAVAKKEETASIITDNNEASKTGNSINDLKEEAKPISWKASVNKLEDNKYEVILDATLNEGWVIYSHFTEENGPVPTNIFFEAPKDLQTVGALREEGKKKDGLDPLFGVNVIKFTDGKARFIQTIALSDPSQMVKGGIEYMVCNDESCTPHEDIFSIQADKSIAQMGDIALTKNPVDEPGVYDSSVPSLQKTNKAPTGDCNNVAATADKGLWRTLVFGFIGGLLALLTPCVFPMLPLTVSYFTKKSKDRASGIRNAVIYGLSIIVIYVTIGLLITALLGPTALQNLATDSIANTIFFVVFVIFALSFFGYYEITLPSSWSTKTDQAADKGGLLGIFFMAFTLAIVSFSCTGPIIGSALVQSATDKLGPFMVMLGFSSALALPFALFAAFPGWLNSLPKSGNWMTSVKVVLGFLELALALKFLSVADMTSHWGVLPYEVFMGLWILIFAAMALYLFGVIRFPHDSKVRKLSIPRAALGALTVAFVIYLAMGFRYNDETKGYTSMAALSGLAPPVYYNLFLPEQALDLTIKTKYPSFSKCANNLDCFKDYNEGIAYAKEVNKPVLLDFTGYGCVNCRKTEEHIWIKDAVRSRIANEYVLISLYTDDRKMLETPVFSKVQQKKLRRVGAKWQDFEISNFEQNSQPLYVLVDPEENVMSIPRGYEEGVQSYIEFLDCGLATFKNKD